VFVVEKHGIGMRWRHDGPPTAAILYLLALPLALEALVKDIDLRPVVVCSRSLHDHQTLVLSAPKRRRTRQYVTPTGAMASKDFRSLEHRVGNLKFVIQISFIGRNTAYYTIESGGIPTDSRCFFGLYRPILP